MVVDLYDETTCQKKSQQRSDRGGEVANIPS